MLRSSKKKLEKEEFYSAEKLLKFWDVEGATKL